MRPLFCSKRGPAFGYGRTSSGVTTTGLMSYVQCGVNGIPGISTCVEVEGTVLGLVEEIDKLISECCGLFWSGPGRSVT